SDLRFMLGPTLLLAMATGHAQETPAPVELTFEQAHARLEQVSDALAAADANLRGKQDLADASRRMRLPELSLEARYMEFQKTLELPPGSLAPVAEAFGIDSPLRFRQRDWRMRPMVTAVLPLYTGGGAAARAGGEADAERAQQGRRLVSELVEAYFGLRLAGQVVAVRREIRDGMERHLAHTALLEREGFATRAQRLQATVARDAS